MAGPQNLHFDSDGERCAATLYLPDGAGPHPIAVLAHGYCLTREARLSAFAERFAGAGVAALTFDYRGFGDSTGEPRQLATSSRECSDLRAAVAFARALEDVDPGRVALWGYSFGGGHVVSAAVEDPRIAAVVSLAPVSDGLATLVAALRGAPVDSIRLMLAGLRDAGAALVGRGPRRIPVAASSGARMMPQPGSYEGYLAAYEDGRGFRNEGCPRATFSVGSYRPIRRARRVSCPLLVLACGADPVNPASRSRRLAELAPRGRHLDFDGCGHFDLLVGELFERTIGAQVSFLREHLGLERGG